MHRTRFHYNGPVRSSYNEARLTPENSTGRRRCARRVEIEPAATAYAYRDYWGTTVTAFDLHSPHAELVVTGTSIVEAGPDLAGHDRVGWGALAAREVRDQFGELLAPTPLTAMDDDVVAAGRATRSATPGRTRPAPRCAGSSATRWSTSPARPNVKTNAMQAWTKGKGVCQDISHVTVGAAARARPARPLRLRLPAPEAEAPRSASRSPGESHAWVEWWDGGWNGFDPTNSVDDRHPPRDRSAAAATTATSRRSRACSPAPRARGTR